MSIHRLYEISRRGLLTAQAGMDVAGHNVANANTEGYSRQRAVLKADSVISQGRQIRTPLGESTGAGVSVERFERMRDGLLEAAAWTAEAGLGAADEQARLLGALEGVLAISGENALTNELNAFWSAWNDVANTPTDTGVRAALLGRADELAGLLNQQSRGLQGVEAETRQALDDGLSTVNSLLADVAGLNERIQQARQGGTPDLDAEDRRDRRVKELAGFLPVNVQPNHREGYTLTVNGVAVVQGRRAQTFVADGPPAQATTTIRYEGTDMTFQPRTDEDGRIGGWLNLLNDALPGVRQSLDDLTESLVTGVNAVHQTGYGLDNSTGADFFDPAGTTAATIRRAVTDPAAVAAAAEPNAPADNRRALDVADLRAGVDDRAIQIAGDIGARIETANSRYTAREASLAHLDGMAQGLSGVSLDEEMTHLVEHQQAYAAAARVLTTAQTMMDTLLSM